ncbi:hypothetical protein E2C01_002207 [Portunus trituberculatus]|uniref:Uncharacterized protein n=1 Tax=Portunus trituberculatus TaxID=210409 RepID=A0A5B7CQ38_PORTR|nr:hypothetical protein [Portunus trituberculatus]
MSHSEDSEQETVSSGHLGEARINELLAGDGEVLRANGQENGGAESTSQLPSTHCANEVFGDVLIEAPGVMIEMSPVSRAHGGDGGVVSCIMALLGFLNAFPRSARVMAWWGPMPSPDEAILINSTVLRAAGRGLAFSFISTFVTLPASVNTVSEVRLHPIGLRLEGLNEVMALHTEAQCWGLARPKGDQRGVKIAILPLCQGRRHLLMVTVKTRQTLLRLQL